MGTVLHFPVYPSLVRSHAFSGAFMAQHHLSDQLLLVDLPIGPDQTAQSVLVLTSQKTAVVTRLLISDRPGRLTERVISGSSLPALYNPRPLGRLSRFFDENREHAAAILELPGAGADIDALTHARAVHLMKTAGLPAAQALTQATEVTERCEAWGRRLQAEISRVRREMRQSGPNAA